MRLSKWGKSLVMDKVFAAHLEKTGREIGHLDEDTKAVVFDLVFSHEFVLEDNVPLFVLSVLTDEIRRVLSSVKGDNNYRPTVLLVRKLTGMGLYESKLYVDKFVRSVYEDHFVVSFSDYLMKEWRIR